MQQLFQIWPAASCMSLFGAACLHTSYGHAALWHAELLPTLRQVCK